MFVLAMTLAFDRSYELQEGFVQATSISWLCLKFCKLTPSVMIYRAPSALNAL